MEFSANGKTLLTLKPISGIVKLMFFDSSKEELDKDINFETKVLLSILSFLNISILFYPKFFLDLSASVTFSLFAVN